MTRAAKPWVYSFAPAQRRRPVKRGARLLPTDADALGNKAANLFVMCALGLPVPPGFTLRSELCAWYHRRRGWPRALRGEVARALARLERLSGQGFGARTNPLLLSVRAGARTSMPGMLDTVLNLGLNDVTVMGLARASDNPSFAYDCYRRFLHAYGELVRGVDAEAFEDIWENYRLDTGYADEQEMRPRDWLYVIRAFQDLIRRKSKKPFPQNVSTQLWDALGAVFDSWTNARARAWRELHQLPNDWGMAVSVQSMVFGNWDGASATGVVFSRNPTTGQKQLYGEFLPRAQGEEVVAGLRTPCSLTQSEGEPSMQRTMPQAFRTLAQAADLLERHFGDMQDIEFTVQQGRLWLLQTRRARRSVAAAVQIAADMVREKRLSRAEALLQLDAPALMQLLHPELAPLRRTDQVLTTGLPASPGAVSGDLVFSSQAAIAAAAQEQRAILVRLETSPQDIQGMVAARGVLTVRGGMTSHAAVVARGLGRPCVSGAGQLQLDERREELRIGRHRLRAGDKITIDGSSGKVLLGEVAVRQPDLSDEIIQLMGWSDRARRLQIRANADNLQDAKAALRYGADGIGLLRTEQMFFASGRLALFRAFLLGEGRTRQTARQALIRRQRADFYHLFRLLGARPIAIRLLDPPLQRFLPQAPDEVAALAARLQVSEARVRARLTETASFNPMLGHRGVRLLLTHNEIFSLQAQAIFEAVALCARRQLRVVPEIMVPFVALPQEFVALRAQAETCAAPFRARDRRFRYRLGILIETPRAALLADAFAPLVDFVSFGSNDLTQLSFGMSRDDAAEFLRVYLQQDLLAADPFVRLDEAGVGALIRMAVVRGRARRPRLLCGLCGEHGGDSASIQFCESLAMDYVSCSPYRVPIARLAAAQAALTQNPARNPASGSR